MLASEGDAPIMDPLPSAELLATIRIVAPKGAESLAESSMDRLVRSWFLRLLQQCNAVTEQQQTSAGGEE